VSGGANLEVMEQAVRYNRFLLDLIQPRGRVLDFGAGTGTFARPLAASGIDIVCVEPDPQEGLKGLRVYRDASELAPDSIDLVYSFNVLEHIADDAAALAALRRVLKPGGRLLLYVPAFMVLYTSMDRRIGHVRRYRKHTLRELVQQAGFKVTEARYADSLGFLAALAYKALGPASGELNPRSVRLYDTYVFPLSRMLDLALDPLIGKNLILRATRA
jgi:SAM-dependent methyltransferase